LFEDCTPIAEDELLVEDIESPSYLQNQYFVEDNSNTPIVELYDASHLD